MDEIVIAIENLNQTLLNDSSDIIMIIITLIYVVATILICWFNYKSAKATREQVEESKKQFDEENRPYLTCEYIQPMRVAHGIRIVNNGRKIAENIKLELDNDFLGSLQNNKLKELIVTISEKRFSLGVGQYYDYFFSDESSKPQEGFKPLTIKLKYENKFSEYEDEFYFPFDIYPKVQTLKTYEEKLNLKLDENNKRLKEIADNLQILNSILIGENDI